MKGVLVGYTVAVLTGGQGREGELSRAGGAAVCAALREAGHAAVELACDVGLVDALRAGRFDAAWPVLPGALGRSGCVQELVEALGIALVGSSSAVCRRMHDKRDLARTVAEALELRTIEASVPWTEGLSAPCLQGMGGAGALDVVAERIPGGYPLVVKPALAGCGLGARVACDAVELRARTEETLAVCDAVVVQEQVEGVEVRVCVLGCADDIQILPPVELRADGTRGVPVRYEALSNEREDAEAIRSEIDRAALDAFLVSGCYGLAEVSIVWDGAQARILDVDTCPQVDDASALALALAKCAIPASEAWGALVEMTLE